MRYFKFIFLLLVLCGIGACNKKLSLDGFELYDQSKSFGKNNYAVITAKYLLSVDIPDDAGISVSQLRAGEIYEVQETKLLTNATGSVLWIKIHDGWVPSNSVQLYGTREKAETAAQELLR